MVPELKKLMKGGDSAQQDDPNAGPPPLQVRGKDAAYLLIQHAQGKPRQELTEAVVGWYVQDFNGRSLAGNYSAEQVVRYLGAPAAKLLVDALNSHMPQVTLVKIAELIGQLGDAETKKAAGKRLVEIEKEMESKKFLDWLSNRIRKELEAQSDEEVDDDRVKAAAVLNREKFINEGALPAMKHLADQKVVADRLVSIASDKKMKIPEVNKKKAEELRTARRKRALLALEGNVTEKHLDEMLTLALSEDNPTAVRDEAFDRIGDIGSKRAIPKLWPLVSGEEQRLRWRAGELVLAIGGNDIVSEFFSKLPEGGDVKYAPEELEGYAQRMSQMNPPPTDIVRRQLRSGSWWDQVIALRFFERKGSEDDISRMKRLTRSESTPKGPGWEEGATVGKVAKEAIDGLKERFQQPSEG
jgi:HEAT repeat protein